MAGKPIPRPCPNRQEKRPFGLCAQFDGHEGDCWYPAETLSERESDVWHARFAITLDVASANDAVFALRRHLASDVPSLLKDPAMEDPTNG